jgi:hypothetical protein
MYRAGTISIANGSKTLTGTGTQWKTVANILAGYLITFDEIRFYEVTSVGSDTSLQIESLIDGLGYQGEALTNAKYVITFPLQSGIAANIALSVLKLQEKWMQRERDITGWMSTDETSHLIESYTGSKVSIVSLQELTRLIHSGQYPGDSPWFDGAGIPDDTIGADGAYYLDTSAGNIYRKTSEAWGYVMTIAGGGGLTEAEILAITDPLLSEDVISTLVTLNQSTANLAQTDTQLAQDYQAADIEITRKASESNPSPSLDLVNHGFGKASYVKIAMQDSIPTESPNNKNEWVIDQVRQQLHVAMTNHYLPVSNVIDSRYFAVFKRGYFLRFDNNSSYTGDITLRVYPVQNGGDGLPNNPTLNNNQWQTYTTTVTDLFKIGTMDDGNYFTGIIDFVSLDTTGRWDRLDRDTCQFSGIKAFVDYQFSAEPKSIFTKFYLQTDGLWYSKNITPLTPAEIGASWVQSGTDYKEYTVINASDDSDSLQLFADDTLEYYTINVVIVTSGLTNNIAVTIGNNANLTIYENGTAKFMFSNTRFYLKRTNPGSAISGTIYIESVKMVLPNE